MDNLTTPNITIAYDAKRAFLNYRGLGNYCRNLFGQMSKYYGEHKYLLCTPKDTQLYPWLGNTPFERVMPTGLWLLTPSLWRRHGIPQSLKERNIDIFHGLSQELPVGIEKLGCKTIVTMHDAIFMRYPELYSATYRLSFIRRNQSACKRADLIVAISEQTKRDYIDFFGVEENRIRVVYQGCNDIYWQPIPEWQLQDVSQQHKLPSSYILSVGALEERKNHIRLIKSIASAKIDLPLVLVGKGNDKRIHTLYNTAKQYGVRLYILTDVQLEHLPAIYHLASVFAYPSVFEGFGIPILEAARCKTPIVTSTGTCFEEIVKEGAMYASPFDVDAIGDAIKTTLTDKKQTSKRITIALAETEKFHAENIAREMMNTYTSLL